MAVGFYCDTVYHLLVALSMGTHEFKNEEKILFLAPHFKNPEKIIFSLKNKVKVFDYVVVLQDHIYDRWAIVHRRLRYFFFYPMVKAASKEYNFTNFILFTCHPQLIALFAKWILKYNPSCRLSLGEDGLASYINQNMYQYPSTKKAKFLFALNGLHKFYEEVNEMYVFEPRLVQNINNYKLKKLQKPDFRDPFFKNIADTLFAKEIVPNVQFLVLQQPFNTKIAQEQKYDDIQNRMLGYLADYSDSVAVKMHPQSQGSFSARSKIKYYHSTTPFEMSMTPEIEQIVLTTLFSTAVFTPYLFWGYKPTILLLYKLAGKNILMTHLDTFVKDFKNIYEKAGGTILLPKNWEEVKGILQRRKV